MVTLGDGAAGPIQIKKDEFIKMENNRVELEPFVNCVVCDRHYHKICVLHHDGIWPDDFVCHNCLISKGKRREENKFSAKNLPKTKLSDYIERKVDPDFGWEKPTKIHIRVVSSSVKMAEVKPGMQDHFIQSSEQMTVFPYRAKTLLAFQERDGIDVCFFGMQVHEYGSECSRPNTRRVYISLLDSVQLFDSNNYTIYQRIIFAYLDYVGQLGYTMVHIWACPPNKIDNNIFHCHPSNEEIPDTYQVHRWWAILLYTAKNVGTVFDYKNIWQYMQEEELKSPTDMPYFEADFWPNFLEDSINELEQADKNQYKQTLNEKFAAAIKKYGKSFFLVRLHSVEVAVSLTVSFA